MAIGLLSVICNGDTISEMKLLAETHELLLREFLELPYGIPPEDTFERVFLKLNPQTLQAQFQTYMKGIKELIQKNATVAIDGKTIHGSRDRKRKAVHVVTAFASELQLVLGQLATDEKTIEKGYGRIETREYFLCPEISWLE